jgi:hypothetical protein
MVSWYKTKVTPIHISIDITKEQPNQRYADTNTYAEQLARVAADISKPSGAMVMVAAIPKTVVIAMALKILTILFPDIKALPFIAVNITKQSIRARTAAQLTRNLPILRFPFTFVFTDYTP